MGKKNREFSVCNSTMQVFKAKAVHNFFYFTISRIRIRNAVFWEKDFSFRNVQTELFTNKKKDSKTFCSDNLMVVSVIQKRICSRVVQYLICAIPSLLEKSFFGQNEIEPEMFALGIIFLEYLCLNVGFSKFGDCNCFLFDIYLFFSSLRLAMFLDYLVSCYILPLLGR